MFLIAIRPILCSKASRHGAKIRVQLTHTISKMTALFRNASHTSKSILSHPFTRTVEEKQDGNDVDSSQDDGTCDAKSTRNEDASPISFPTLRQLPIPKPSTSLYTGTSRLDRDFEDELGVARSKQIQDEMPLENLDEFDVMVATSDRHSLLDSAGTGVNENRPTETWCQEKDPKYLQMAFNGDETCEKILKLSPSQLIKLASTPSSLPRGPLSSTSSSSDGENSCQAVRSRESHSQSSSGVKRRIHAVIEKPGIESYSRNGDVMPSMNINKARHRSSSSGTKFFDQTLNSNTTSSPNAAINATDSSFSPDFPQPAQVPDQFDLGPPPCYSLKGRIDTRPPIEETCPSPIPTSMPLPPFSLPTYLHLELSSNKPSPLYIYRSKTSEIPYEPSRVKIERLLNFLLLPPQLEQVLLFGTLACLDAFLYSFTILPLRFFKALSIIAQSLGRNVANESQYIAAFIYSGAVRVWKRKRSDSMNSNNGSSFTNDSLHNLNHESVPAASQFSSSIDGKTRSTHHPHPEPTPVQGKASRGTRPRFQATPSTLLPEQKADLLKGFLLILSCTILMYFDASRMYHGIRGQAAIKLYVIYNVLEVSRKA